MKFIKQLQYLPRFFNICSNFYIVTDCVSVLFSRIYSSMRIICFIGLLKSNKLWHDAIQFYHSISGKKNLLSANIFICDLKMMGENWSKISYFEILCAQSCCLKKLPERPPKGQLNSEWIYQVIVSPKMQT